MDAATLGRAFWSSWSGTPRAYNGPGVHRGWKYAGRRVGIDPSGVRASVSAFLAETGRNRAEPPGTPSPAPGAAVRL